MELYPAVDIVDGRAVRLVQGDFARQSDYGDPRSLARRYAAAGARWVHVVDLDAARTGRPQNRPTVLAIAALDGVRVQAGGGVRTEADLAELLDGGVDRVVLGTVALEAPDVAVGWARAYPGRVALGLDYRHHAGRLEAAGRGWTSGTGPPVDEVLEALSGAPWAAVVATAITRDGTLDGPDTEGLGRLVDRVEVPVVASGGVARLEDLERLGALAGPASGRGLAGAVVGRALVDGRIDLGEAMSRCAPCG
ncbi:MAG TPA: HisA/HisF-related TIM barrel protein [Acidimicrobiales bacterium]|nr:HisA/HisF-related TIM barrel protein [Acidimicrobiales bacterium]